jgi:hypothetical protein
MTDSVDKLAKLYVNEVIRLHGVPMSIMLELDPRFTSRLWPSLQKALRTKLNLSTTSHPQTDGQSRRTIQTLEDFLGSCVLEFGGNWEYFLPLMEFTYNNGHQAILVWLHMKYCMEEMSYPICWEEVRKKKEKREKL